MSGLKRGGDRRTPQEHQAAQERAAQMAALRAQGWKLARIAQEFGVTRQRVHAILAAQDPGELATWQVEQAHGGSLLTPEESGVKYL